MKYYGVKIGRVPGVYTDWEKALEQTKNFSGAIVKSFKHEEEALSFVNGCSHEQKYYVVRRGRIQGIFRSEEYWKKQFANLKGAEFKSFVDGIEAIRYFSETVTAEKYYAIQKGKQVGVFVDRNVYLQNIKNFSDAKGKSFNTLIDAVMFMGGNQEVEAEMPNEITVTHPKVSETHCVAYVDGSYCDKTKAFSMGVVMLAPDKQIEIQKAFNNPNYIKYCNVAGELTAAKEAVKKAIALGYPELTIMYDFKGVEDYLSGNVKVSTPLASEYKKYMKKSQKHIKINFQHVKSHSSVKYNDLADNLAKSAIKNQHFTQQISIDAL